MNTASTNWGQAEAIQDAGLHSHTCCYCGQDYGCEGESCKATTKQMCEDCELYHQSL